tara:strand:+ start:112 stop:543 length:432 start_codon:yes stop_codon:yes gene_type:complete
MTKEKSKSIYLIGPLIAGFFFALGYGIAHRSWVLMGSWQEISNKVFHLKQSPGKKLEQFLVHTKEDGKKAFTSKKLNSHLSRSSNKNIHPLTSDFDPTSLINKEAEPTKMNSEQLKIRSTSPPRNEPAFTNEKFNAVIQALPE